MTAVGRACAAAGEGAPPPLRLRDAGSRELRTVPLAGRRRVSVAWVPSPAGRSGALRPALTADLIRRLVELRGGQAVVSASELSDLLRYNIHPADRGVPPAAADVVVGAVMSGRLSVAVGPISGPALVGGDPLALRLLVLAAPHAAPVVVDRAGVAAASTRLAGWRRVVVWGAAVPSSSIPPRYVGELHERACDDLDTPGLLDLLDRIASDDDVSPGSRLEFLLYADRLLGLDLAAGLGTGSR